MKRADKNGMGSDRAAGTGRLKVAGHTCSSIEHDSERMNFLVSYPRLGHDGLEHPAPLCHPFMSVPQSFVTILWGRFDSYLRGHRGNLVL